MEGLLAFSLQLFHFGHINFQKIGGHMTKELIILTDKILKRFWEKVEKTTSCWLWKGATTTSGHGRFKINGLMYGPHRISYEIHKGPIPKGLFICHRCPNGDNSSCVNPEHLYAGTAQDNALDEVRKEKTRHFKVDNPTKFKGIRWDKSRNGWISYVYIDKKLIDIGRHASEVDAARNYDRILYMKYGIKSGLNFPEEYNIKD